MEQSSTMISSKSAGGRSSTVLRNVYLKIGYPLWQERGASISRGSKFFQSMSVPSSIQEIMILILHCKTVYCYRKGLPSTSTTSGTRVN